MHAAVALRATHAARGRWTFREADQRTAEFRRILLGNLQRFRPRAVGDDSHLVAATQLTDDRLKCRGQPRLAERGDDDQQRAAESLRQSPAFNHESVVKSGSRATPWAAARSRYATAGSEPCLTLLV